MSQEFWRNKRVLVTGGAGFIGSHVVEMLVRMGARVRVPVRQFSKPSPFLSEVASDVERVEADLNNPDASVRVAQNMDIILHLAAHVGGVAYNMAHPAKLFSENVRPTINIVEAARKAGVERLLITSSACVYQRDIPIPVPESEGFVGTPEPTNEGYGLAKRMAEYLGQKAAEEYGIKVAIARPFNAYGPRDNFDPETSHVIPSLIRRVLAGENPFMVWGTGEQSRSFLYVTDFARGLLSVAEEYAIADPVHLATDEETTIRDLVDLIVRLSGRDVEIRFDPTKPSGQPRRAGDTTKMKKKLSFRPIVSLEDGLRRTMEWYQSS